MNIAIDDTATLLGQSLAEIISARALTRNRLISILHGSVDTLNDGDSDQINADKDFDFDYQFLSELDFSTIDIVFIAANHPHNQNAIDEALANGVTVIDCAGNNANQADIPLIVHDINSHEIQGLKPGFVIATPGAAATMLSQVVFPLVGEGSGLRRVNVCHFAPAANLGTTGVEQLASQTARLLNGMPLEKGKSNSNRKRQGVEQIAFNLLPQTGAIDDLAYAQTETQLMRETKQLLNDDSIVINASCIQVPVFYAQSQVVDLTFAAEVDPRRLEKIFKQRDGIRVSQGKHASPVAVQAQDDHNDIVVSRIRQNPDDKCSLTLWCVSDSLRRGAAGNAVQIADLLIKSYL